jgi:DNA-3-methyladenine glycosylase II
VPFSQAIQQLSQDRFIGPLIKKYGTCTLTPRTDYFLVLCESIISQQISVKAAEAILRRFIDLFDGDITPERAAELSPEILKSAGVSAQKAKYLLDLAEKFAGEIDFLQFNDMDNEQIIAELIKVKGIGRWTAMMFLIFALNRQNVLPVEDLGIRRAIQIQYSLPELATPEQIRLIAKYWQPYETIACWYLWRSLENAPLDRIG